MIEMTHDMCCRWNGVRNANVASATMHFGLFYSVISIPHVAPATRQYTKIHKVYLIELYPRYKYRDL